jgi:hypothetical protein
VLVDIGHPAHVHFFKHAMRRLQSEGHPIQITARSKDVTETLLAAYGFQYRLLSSSRENRLSEFVRREYRLWLSIRKFRPDVIAAVGGAFITPVGRLAGRPTVVFTDTEHVAADRYLTYPWATRICTPASFLKDLGPRQRRYRGFQELAYLDPRRFRPDPSVLDEVGVKTGEPFTVMRFVSWQASHDRGHRGFSETSKADAISQLERHGRVLVSSEGPLPQALRGYELRIAPHRVHDLLALANLYIGEGATMATEAALLGTPSIYLSSLVGTMGNFERLGAEELVLSFRDEAPALGRALSLLADPRSKATWQDRSWGFVASLADVSDFVHGQILEAAAG